MTAEYDRLVAICRRLLEWERATGGWEAPVWEELRAALRAPASPPTAGEDDTDE